jgi:hypothetical protein
MNTPDILIVSYMSLESLAIFSNDPQIKLPAVAA